VCMLSASSDLPDGRTFLERHLACQSITTADCRFNDDGSASLPVTCGRCCCSAVLVVPSHLLRDVLDDLAATVQTTVEAELKRRLRRLLTRLVEPNEEKRPAQAGNFTPSELVALLSDNHRLTPQQVNSVALSLAALPRDVVERVVRSCYIVTCSSNDPAWAFKFTPEQHPYITGIIFLNPDVFLRPLPFLQEVLAHEVAHILLRHHAAQGDTWQQQVQEAEADELMCRWLGRDPPPIPRLEA
jgi:hypothetical protein